MKMTNRYSIDRFEGDIAVCEKEEGGFVNIPRLKLPSKAKEGDVIIKSGDEFQIDVKETERRKKDILKLLKKIENKNGL